MVGLTAESRLDGEGWIGGGDSILIVPHCAAVAAVAAAAAAMKMITNV